MQAAAPYKNRDPNSADEVEHLGDLMGILCSCLLDASARSTFLQAEGIELMLLIIKQKRTARTGALKACPLASGLLKRCVGSHRATVRQALLLHAEQSSCRPALAD